MTIDCGIEIQTMQLAKWKEILKDEVYNDLVTYGTRNNSIAKSGYDICRGCDLTAFVDNWLYYKSIRYDIN